MIAQDKRDNDADANAAKPVEVMPATPGRFDARDWLRATLHEYGCDYYQAVAELPFDIDSSNATNMECMFDRFESLTIVPNMDTSRVENINSMFNNCESLTEVPDMDTSQVENMDFMFTGCSSLITVPAMDSRF